MQRLNEERERIERAYDQLQDENAQLKQANELKQVAVSMHAARHEPL